MPVPAELQGPVRLVLIVDDEPEVVELLMTLFETTEEDVEVAGVQSGVDALLLIGERKPDLLILDTMMPGMNGIEVCRKLKVAPTTRNLKIIAISGDHDPALRDHVLDAGADRFFAKPFDMLLFRDECLNLLQLPKAR
jgi:CheY-like chemotaxis protein